MMRGVALPVVLQRSRRVTGYLNNIIGGGVAQWLEQRTHNPLVEGSIPSTPTIRLVNSLIFRP